MERFSEFASKRDLLLADLDSNPSGLVWCERHSNLADQVVEALVSADTPLSVVATGGYGRRELSPFSDIDLTVVPLDEGILGLDTIVRRLYHDLHDAFAEFGLALGYSYRLVSDVPGLDPKTRTGLLDMRYVAGDPRVFRQLANAMGENFPTGDFALAKLREREMALLRTHDTPLVAEPDLKEGAGGLRDFQAANWLRSAIGERTMLPDAAYDTVLEARNLLHRDAERAQDCLSLNRLRNVALRAGSSPEVYADRLTYARLSLAQEYARARTRLREARFEFSPGVFAVRGEIRFAPTATAGAAALGVAIGIQLGLSVGDFSSPPPSSEAGPETLRVVEEGERTLRALDEAGLLKRILPELTSLRARLPHDAVHAYTVMEHTLRAVAEIDAIPVGSFMGGLLSGLPDRGRLFLATILHDVGKAQGDEGHAARGAVVAETVARRWRLAEPVVADVAWLVAEHLTMARFVRVRDLERAETIEEFAGIVRTFERLTMLTILTYADIKAVAPGVWTPAMDTFLRQLYERTAARIEADRPVSPDLEGVRRRLVRRLNEGPADAAATERFVLSMPADYFASTPADLVALHVEYARRAAGGEPTVEAHPRPDLGATELTVVCQDSPGLLSRLLAVLYANDLGIVSLRARTALSQPAVVLDSFVASFGDGPIPEATLRTVSATLRNVVLDQRDADEILRARGLDPLRRQELFRWNYVEGTPGILEIRAQKGRGMPYRMARRLAALGWNVVSARVGQWAGNAAAAFYIVGEGGVAIKRDAVAAAFSEDVG